MITRNPKPAYDKMKERDMFNRRQKERPLKLGLHDISLARYFTIGESSERYSISTRQFSDDYAVYSQRDQVECIGFASPDRNKILITVRHHGLDWTTRIALSDIHIFGNKLPSEK